MTQETLVGLWLGLTVVAANLPWLSERWLFVISIQRIKPFWFRLIEWGLLYGLVIGVGFGFEYKMTGTLHAQDWEFHVVTLCLFAVGAVPGFLYRYQLRPLLWRAGR